jgi:hypothetical protein
LINISFVYLNLLTEKINNTNNNLCTRVVEIGNRILEHPHMCLVLIRRLSNDKCNYFADIPPPLNSIERNFSIHLSSHDLMMAMMKSELYVPFERDV